MYWVLLASGAIGALVHLGVRQHLRERARRERESRGAKALYEEMDAALRSVNMAARNAESRWVTGLAESPTLAETWIAHGRAFEWLDLATWEILDDAVKAVEPIYGLGLVGARIQPMRPSLEERQQKLRRGMDVVRTMLPPEAEQPQVARLAMPSLRRRPS